MATCVDIYGFQFTITVNGELLTDDLDGSLGSSSAMDVTGGAGNVVGLDLSGNAKIPGGM